MFFFSVIADEDEIGDINPVERGCLFKHEKQLKIHRFYTRANCIFECELLYAYHITNEVFKIRIIIFQMNLQLK